MQNRRDRSPQTPDLGAYPELLAPKDVAKILGMSNDRVYRLFHSKDFPSIVIGRAGLRIPKARLAGWLGAKD